MQQRKIIKINTITRPEKLDSLHEYEINLLPKIKIETVVCEMPVETFLKTAEKILRTGKFSDGKIFVYELANAVRIRTGQRGAKAIMDIPEEVGTRF